MRAERKGEGRLSQDSVSQAMPPSPAPSDPAPPPGPAPGGPARCPPDFPAAPCGPGMPSGGAAARPGSARAERAAGPRSPRGRRWARALCGRCGPREAGFGPTGRAWTAGPRGVRVLPGLRVREGPAGRGQDPGRTGRGSGGRGREPARPRRRAQPCTALGGAAHTLQLSATRGERGPHLQRRCARAGRPCPAELPRSRGVERGATPPEPGAR